MSNENNTERLLGTMLARIDALDGSVERIERELREQRTRWGTIEQELRTDVQALRDFTLEIKGGRKALVALLGVAATLGGLLWEIIQRLLPIR